MTAKVIEDEPDFKILMTELDRLYTQAKASCVNLDALLKTDCINRILQALASTKSELSKYSETSKLMVHQRSVWTMSAPVNFTYNDAMQ